MSDAEEVAAVPAAARPHGLRERDWFEGLFESHLDAVHWFLLRRGASDDAEDLCSDVFTTAWRRRADLSQGYELAWLYRTAGDLLARFRRKGRAEPVELLPGDGKHAPDPAETAVTDAAVQQVLGRLSAKDRHVLLLHAWEGLDGEGLGHALGFTRGGAATALSRARSRLREAWQERPRERCRRRRFHRGRTGLPVRAEV